MATCGPGKSHAVQAPGGRVQLQAGWLAGGPLAGWSGCTAAGGNLHCYLPSDIREAYGVDQLTEKGDGQTIVLVDSCDGRRRHPAPVRMGVGSAQ